jgi:EAL domain-containing protein (putative c-di-GMP-specific phosphodiesterase class I)/ActR/RegA family two-component response regulator
VDQHRPTGQPLGYPVRVIVADDDPDIQVLLADLIGDTETLELVGSARDAEEAIDLAIRERPDVALLDVRMPGDGLVAAAAIRRRAPGTRVLALSSEDDRRTVVAMLEAGAVGYLLKDAPSATIVESILRAVSGEGSLARGVTAGVIEELVERRGDERRADARRREMIVQIQRAIDEPEGLVIHLQPICSLRQGTVVGFEALSRFGVSPAQPPDAWFADAEKVDLRTELELLAVERALALLPGVPASAYLAVNASPTTAISDGFSMLIDRCDATRVVVEITEGAPIDDYELFDASMRGVRERGVRLAIDDAGAGFASLRHILNLVPDLIKLDGTLIAGIEADRARQALAAGLISFAGHLGASIVAECIESAGQLAALRTLGVEQGQGYFLSRPQLPDIALDRATIGDIEHRPGGLAAHPSGNC